MKNKELRILVRAQMIVAAILITLLLLFSSCTVYQSTSTRLIDDLGIDYKIMKSVKSSKVAGYTNYNTGEIRVEKGRHSTVTLIHESVHYMRSESNMLVDPYLEEVIACKTAFKVAKKAGIPIGMSKYELPSWINASIKANDMKIRLLSREERGIVNSEIERTIDAIETRLNVEGKSLTDIDWVKTAILILI